MVDAKLIGAGVITLIVLIGAGYVSLTEGFEPTHYCEDRQAYAFCFVLSSTGKTCYTKEFYTGGKRCSSIWKVIDKSTYVIFSPGEVPDPTQNCLRQGGYCYCNPRGLLANKIKCEDL